jgi:hypothetical protein
MEYKTCNSCNEIKSIAEFGTYTRRGKTSLRSECKQCHVVRETTRNKDNPNRKQYTKTYRDGHKQEIKEYERIRAVTKRETDLQFKLKTDIVSHARHFLKGERKSYKPIQCTLKQLRLWVEYMFQPEMDWNDKSKWQVDHVIPLSFFDLTNSNEYKIACHWSSIRPVFENEIDKKDLN